MPLVTPEGQIRPLRPSDLAERGQNHGYFRRKGSKKGQKRVILADFQVLAKTGVRVFRGCQAKVNGIAVWQRGCFTSTKRPFFGPFWPKMTTFYHFSGPGVEFQLKHFSKSSPIYVNFVLVTFKTGKALLENRSKAAKKHEK